MHDTIEKLKDNNEINYEAEVLRKLHYKFKNQWRRTKVLRALKQVHNIWKKFKAIDLISLLTELKELLPCRNTGLEEEYLPSFFVIYYNLSILLRACTVLKDASLYCTIGCSYTQQQISAYLFAKYMTICYAAFSKFYSLCQTTMNTLAECYTSLRELLVIIKIPVSSLEEIKILPTNIKEWLKSDATISSPLGGSQKVTNQDEEKLQKSPTMLSKTETLLPTLALTETTNIPSSLPTSTMLSTSTEDVVLAFSANSASFPTKATTFPTKSTTSPTKVTSPTQQLPSKKCPLIDKTESKKREGKNEHTTPGNCSPKKKTFALIGREEHRKMTNDIEQCSTIGQLVSLVRDLKKSTNGEKLRGLKVCMEKLKSLREERISLSEDDARKNKMEMVLMKRSKKVAMKLVSKNTKSWN